MPGEKTRVYEFKELRLFIFNIQRARSPASELHIVPYELESTKVTLYWEDLVQMGLEWYRFKEAFPMLQ
ncbi:polyketide synthase [Aspergillus luchuensis]|uniref:Polyketide synthase n=1 Tax=Aspergillus kawachii TaxID=1069201 RepID=A0A146FCX0_ASPKA|nr:polyketide synthase [Aspergillus luchuensis]